MTEKENETRERITALYFKGKTKTTKEEPENVKKKKLKKKKKIKDDTNTFFWLYFLDCWMISCVVFYILIRIVVLVVTVILFVKSAEGRVLDYMIVTDCEIRKEENREKEKENHFPSII